MESLFSGLAFILLLQSLLALIAGVRFTRYVLRSAQSRFGRYQPKAAIIVPCKGLDPHFEENISALLRQRYRDYEIIFVTESESDPAYAVLTRLIKQGNRAAWLVVAGEAQGRGQKVHNLCAALEMLERVDRRAEVIVFADADARPAPYWLAELVAPLGEKKVGATTGFRWYLPERGRFCSLLLSAWNATAITLLGENSSFAWGGAMAIRRETFEKLEILRHWQGAVSDDYALSRVVKAAGQQIKFVPACLMVTQANTSWRQLLEFTTRQLTITRVYAPRLWAVAAAIHLFYSFTFWGGLILLGVKSLNYGFDQVLASLLAGIFSLGAMASYLRATVAAQLLAAHHKQPHKRWRIEMFFGPLVSLLYLYNILVSAFTRRIVWRGIGYEMVSPTETVISHRPLQPLSPDPSVEAPSSRQASAPSSSSSS